jgi:hypothetical protein
MPRLLYARPASAWPCALPLECLASKQANLVHQASFQLTANLALAHMGIHTSTSMARITCGAAGVSGAPEVTHVAFAPDVCTSADADAGCGAASSRACK